jgi:serine/threonine protein kinase
MQKLNCENILRLIDVYKTQNTAYIISEVCDGGDLSSFMKEN